MSPDLIKRLGYASGWRAYRISAMGRLPFVSERDAHPDFLKAWDYGYADAHFEDWIDEQRWRFEMAEMPGGGS